MKNIKDVASKLGLNSDELFMYGNYMAKVTRDVDEKESKVILVTAINPTKYGEGKTTISIGLNDSLNKLDKKSVAVLREPSLGPVFGLKGGATGGGKSILLPSDKIDLHFTGDFHAITSANNLLSAAIDNHIFQGNELGIKKVVFKRCLDINDRSLRDSFNITAASEVMAIFCLAKDRYDLLKRLGNILIGYDVNDNPIYSRSLKVENAMYKLLEDAFYPNLVQSLYGNPVLIHGGPFANIAHGCNSIVATKLGMSLADYVVTEAGFGSDLGCEKFIDIKCRESGIIPSMIVLVVSTRALNSIGYDNLQAHIDNLNNYKVPFCVAINHFEDDNVSDIHEVYEICKANNVECFTCNSFVDGEDGCIDIANYIIDSPFNRNINFLYEDINSVVDKINNICTNVYKASDINYSDLAKDKIDKINSLGLSEYSICVCKTPLSLSDNPQVCGYPKNYSITVNDIIIQTGSKLLVVMLNDVITMPGLPKNPKYEEM